MAENVNTVLSDAGKAETDLQALALLVQDRGQEAAHLIGAIDDATDEITASSTQAMEALDRVLVFCRLARTALRPTIDLGEQIEGVALSQNRAARAGTARLGGECD